METKDGKKLVPTKLGRIVARWNADPFIASDLMKVLRVSGDLDLAVESYANLIYELRLCLIANDDNEEVYRNATYEVTEKEFKLLDKYKNLEDTEELPPDVNLVLDAKTDSLIKENKELLAIYEKLAEYKKRDKENEEYRIKYNELLNKYRMEL